MIRKKPNPMVKTQDIDIPDSTQIFAELGLKSLAQQLPVHIDSQKYLNISSPIGVLQFLKILAGIQAPTEVLEEIIGRIFKTSRELELIHGVDKIMLCATNMKDLEGQLEEAIEIVGRVGVVFDGIHIGNMGKVCGIKLRCQASGPPMILAAS